MRFKKTYRKVRKHLIDISIIENLTKSQQPSTMLKKAAQLKYKKRTFFYAGHCMSQQYVSAYTNGMHKSGFGYRNDLAGWQQTRHFFTLLKMAERHTMITGANMRNFSTKRSGNIEGLITT